MSEHVSAVLVSSVVLGAIYAMISVGFVVLFRSTKVMSFAQGSFMLLGALVYYQFSGPMKLPVGVSIALAVVLTGIFGALVLAVIFRRLSTADAFLTSVATLGLSGVMQAVISVSWGNSTRTVPSVISSKTVHFAGIRVAEQDLGIVVVLIVLVCLLVLLATKSRFGQQMSAVADNPSLAAHLGINPARIAGGAWALSAATSALAGIAFILHTTLDPTAIPTLGLLVFPAIILGGIESILGAVIGSFLLALVQSAAATWIGGQWQDVAAYGVMFVVLMARPQGLLGRAEVIRV
jgi:branched-chain amino acid transport system permease protein